MAGISLNYLLFVTFPSKRIVKACLRIVVIGEIFCCNADGSKKTENENFGDMFTREFQNMLIPSLAIALIISSFSLGSREQQEASMFG